MGAPLPPIERKAIDPAFLDGLADRFGFRCHRGEAMLRQHGASEAHFATYLPDAVVFAPSVDFGVFYRHIAQAAP